MLGVLAIFSRQALNLFLIALVLLSLPIFRAAADEPENLFSFKKSEGVSLQSAKSWEIKTYSVGLKKIWKHGKFIFKLPGARPLLADSAKRLGSVAATANQKIMNGRKVTTIKGKLYTYNKARGKKKHRVSKRQKSGIFTISEVVGVSGSGLHGFFQAPNGREYQLEGTSSAGTYKLIEIDSLKEPACAGDLPAIASGDFNLSHAKAHHSNIGIKSTSQVKVLTLYSTSAKIAAGGDASIVASINSMINYANTAYTNSGIDAQVVLANAQELSGPDENADFEINLDRITDLDDGFWDDIASIRTAHGADMVVMIVNSSQYCGLAWVAPGESSYAFSVTNRGCTSSFAHELGHNFGAMHDLANAGGAGPFPHGYGWRFTGNSDNQYRTIMSYAPGTRIPYFSNPDVSYDGQATGVADSANNALVLNTTMPLASAFVADPVASPTVTPTLAGTSVPTATPIESATATPVPIATVIPTEVPTPISTAVPSAIATPNPTSVPPEVPATAVPSATPVETPVVQPTSTPTTIVANKALKLRLGKVSRKSAQVILSVDDGGLPLANQSVKIYKVEPRKRSTLARLVTSVEDGSAKFSIKRISKSQKIVAVLPTDGSVSSNLLTIPAGR